VSNSQIKEKGFIGYEYKDITVNHDMESMYIDGYQNFGWTLDKSFTPQIGLNKITLKFKRDRKIRNKMELTRLQRQFDTCVSEIVNMEKSKVSNASIVAYTVGIMGTAFMAGATFAVIAEKIALSIILAIPAFIGWIFPYFLYRFTYEKKASELTPLVDDKYEEIYGVCERANSLSI